MSWRSYSVKAGHRVVVSSQISSFLRLSGFFVNRGQKLGHVSVWPGEGNSLEATWITFAMFFYLPFKKQDRAQPDM